MKLADRLICLALVIITFGIYSQSLRSDFVFIDDTIYVTANPNIQSGLTVQSVEWAFTTGWATNWHPLTWLSHELDIQLFGLNPHGHHLTNLLFHSANSALLFFVLLRYTKRRWPSAIVAALFAWHPLHVESVAWIAERKDVLSCLFWLLTMLAYLRYVEKSTTARYLVTALLFALGLMAKPMLVTLPFVLLLLDYWPLNRFAEPWLQTGPSPEPEMLRSRAVWKQLFTEKVPFFALAGISSVVTIMAQQEGGAVMSTESLPIGLRFSTALLSYCRYLAKMFRPRHLSVYYPYQPFWPAWMVIGAVLFLGFITFRAFQLRRSQPFLVVGWFWYLGTLVPVIGLIQVGSQAMADRYTYIPSIGIFVMIVWGIDRITSGVQWQRKVVAVGSSAALIACLILTWTQVRLWTNSELLFRHALEVAPRNSITLTGLAEYLRTKDRTDEAITEYRAALAINPTFDVALLGLGTCLLTKEEWQDAAAQFIALMQIHPNAPEAECKLGIAQAGMGNTQHALEHYQTALRTIPDFAEAHLNLADLLASQGQAAEAQSHYTDALKSKPDYAEAHRGLGVLLAKQGKLDDATAQFSEAIRLKPGLSEAHYDLGLVQIMQGRAGVAIPEYEEAIRLKPAWAGALNDLAWIEATHPDPSIRNGPNALRLAQRACQLDGGKEPRYLGTLDAAYAETGRFADAIEIAQKVRDMALAQGRQDIAAAAEKRLENYHANKPWHQVL